MSNRFNGLNHSRNLLHISRDIADREYEQLKSLATSRQKKFLFRLACELEEHGIEYGMNRSQVWNRKWNRIDAADKIDEFINMLRQNGIDEFGNGKQFSVEITIDEKTDTVKQRLVQD